MPARAAPNTWGENLPVDCLHSRQKASKKRSVSGPALAVMPRLRPLLQHPLLQHPLLQHPLLQHPLLQHRRLKNLMECWCRVAVVAACGRPALNWRKISKIKTVPKRDD